MSVMARHIVRPERADLFRALLDRAACPPRSARPGPELPPGLVAAVALHATQPLFDGDGTSAARGAVAIHGAQRLRLLRPVRCAEELVSTSAVRSVKRLSTVTATEVVVVLTADGVPAAEATSLLVHSDAVTVPPRAAARGPARDVGAERTSAFRVTRELVREYAELSGDHNPIHLSEVAARDAGFPGVIAHGMLTFALVGRHLADIAEEGRPSELQLRFAKPLVVGHEPAPLTVTDRPAPRSGPGTEDVLLTVVDATGTAVATGRAVLPSPRTRPDRPPFVPTAARPTED